jgi:hypothetical protein
MLSLPLLHLAQEHLFAAIEAGWGKQDWSVLAAFADQQRQNIPA